MGKHSYDPNWKMRIVVDRNLPPGAVVAQALHALVEFGQEHPETVATWHQLSNSVVAMGASSTQLEELIERCKKKHVRYSVFREPDLEDRLTAVAVEPTRDGKRVTSNYPLALRDL